MSGVLANVCDSSSSHDERFGGDGSVDDGRETSEGYTIRKILTFMHERNPKDEIIDLCPVEHNSDDVYYALAFISSRGNEYFCEIDEDYLNDRFNLTGLNTEVQNYQYALDLITDVFDLDCDDDVRDHIDKSARHLYGLVHARYIVTTRGLAKMVILANRLVPSATSDSYS
ncbi:MAG: hypothetical protein Q9227_008249 [Pyrenula ochraceoflavens]